MATLLPRPNNPPSSWSATSLSTQWYKYALQEEALVAARDATIADLNAQIAAYSNSLADIQAKLAAIAARLTVVILPASTTTLTISWDDNSTNESGFRIERSTDGGVTWAKVGEVPANVTTWKDNNVGPGTYAYRIAAFNTAEVSAFSNVAVKTVP